MDNKISIDELNYAIDQCREGIVGADFIEYHFLEYASQELTKKARITEKPVFVKYFSHEEAIGIVLNFFKSLGVEEWYNKAKSILLSQSKDIGISIFNYSEVKNKNITDENGIMMYAPGCNIESRIESNEEGIIKSKVPKSHIRIAKNSRYLCAQHIFDKDKMTLDDINSIVHEIAHCFDITNDWEKIGKRNVIAEILPFCFEAMLNNYLLENKIADEAVINCLKQERIGDVVRHARYVYTVANLMNIQEKDGEITKEGIDKFLKANDIHDINYVRDSFLDVIDSNYDFDYHAKYLISGLTASRFFELFKKDKTLAIENLKKYCQCLLDGEINEETLKLVDFPNDDKKIRETVDNFIDYSKGSR